MNEYQESMHDKLFAIYDKYGLEPTFKIAHESLKAHFPTLEAKQKFNGEVCEAVLEIQINHWIKRYSVDACYIRSLILPDAKSKNKNFLTEIDMVLFTPWCVYCIECKSYSGDKILMGYGTLLGGSGKRCNVFKQNAMHLKVLDNMIGGLAVKPKYQMIMFNFSNGEITDNRSEKAKRELPVVNETNLFAEIYKLNDKNWDMGGIRKAIPIFEQFSDNNRERHLEYVQSLRRGHNG